MRVLPAGAGPGGVNGAIIVGAEERTGSRIEYVVAVFVQVQVLIDQLTRFEVEVTGEAVDVDVAEDGAGGFAAVGAVETVDALKNLFVEVVEPLVEVFRRPDLQSGEELFVGLTFVAGLLDGFLYVHTGVRALKARFFVG